MGIGFALGKGLHEPCSPYRDAYFFGAELNAVYADDWNCNPEIVDRGRNFDLSQIEEYNEVCVALINVTNARSGTYHFRFEFYKQRTNELIFDWEWSYYASSGGWVYAYAYIGYCPWEINENGEYRVEVSVSGAQSFSQEERFTVFGIPPTGVPPPEPVPAVTQIIELFNNVGAFCYSIYLEVLGWTWPFYLTAEFFYSLSVAFNNLAWAFYNFNDWVLMVSAKITTVLDFDEVIDALQTWLNYATWAWEWVSKSVENVTEIVTDWWGATSNTIRCWIDAATEGLDSLEAAWSNFWSDTWPAWTDKLEGLRSDWANFWSVTFPTLVSFNWLDTWWSSRLAEVNTLIDSAITNAFPFYEDLTQLWGEIRSFFADPLEWAYTKLDEFFDRFW